MIRLVREADDRLEGVARLVADAAPRMRVDPDQFDERVMREIRARRSAPSRQPLLFPQPDALRPLALAAAVALMVVAGALSLMLGVPSSPSPAVPATQASFQTDDAADPLEDAVSLPREVPFMVEGDLVGARRGTIPLTTYVLEPPPEQAAVVRASL